MLLSSDTSTASFADHTDGTVPKPAILCGIRPSDTKRMQRIVGG